MTVQRTPKILKITSKLIDRLATTTIIETRRRRTAAIAPPSPKVNQPSFIWLDIFRRNQPLLIQVLELTWVLAYFLSWYDVRVN